MVKKNQSALLAKYLSLYNKNPRSRVFAPLAESYRKLAMLEEAYKILKDGIRHHPNYPLGYIVLAHCYFDEKKYDLVYSTLRPIIHQNADNISLQKVFAQACIHLGNLDEALDIFKYLLFMNPRDKYFAEQVRKLEDDLMVGYKKLSLEQLIKSPDMPLTRPAPPSFDDDWVQVDFNHHPSEAAGEDHSWVMEKGTIDHPLLKKKTIPEPNLEDDFYADEFEQDEDSDAPHLDAPSSESPLVSHTLIDLYCDQQYYDKAIELLEKILQLNPDDKASLKKLIKVKELKTSNSPPRPVETEQDGHNELLSIIENKVKAKTSQEVKLQATFESFLYLIKVRSASYQG